MTDGANFPEPKPVRGKRFVPLLLVGFVVFTVVGMLSTYLIANLTAPYLKKNADAARARFEREHRR